MELIFFVVLILYALYIIPLYFGFDKIKEYSIETTKAPKTKFTIIVPFRNEAKNLPKLLHSFSKLEYPKNLLEIILIDDDSSDNSSSLFIKWRMQNDEIDTTLLENLRLTNSPKKDAISRAMPIAKNPWIITTDADCEVNENWLTVFDHYIQTKNPEMIAAPVVYKTKNNWFHQFQQMDLISLQITTIGSFGISKPFMCNGANFAYTKQLFHELDGFNGNSSITSGDDVFLLQKALLKHPEKVSFLKNDAAIVTTKPENDLYKLFMQRVRWASKTSSYHSWYPKLLALVVYFTNTLVIIGIVLATINFISWELFLIFFVLKYAIDLIFLSKSKALLSKKSVIIPLSSSIIYPLFVSIVGFYSLFGTFKWKKRKFRK
jgi:cellulose synthase/poly-beta-1,6-N-acetylglucosamine synthase-like glycosyltransferase